LDNKELNIINMHDATTKIIFPTCLHFDITRVRNVTAVGPFSKKSLSSD